MLKKHMEEMKQGHQVELNSTSGKFEKVDDSHLNKLKYQPPVQDIERIKPIIVHRESEITLGEQPDAQVEIQRREAMKLEADAQAQI